MQASIFRRLRLATAAFLAVLVVALVVTAALTVRDQRRLREARGELGRLSEFERIHVVSSELLIHIGESTAEDPGNCRLMEQNIDRLSTLAGDPETPTQLLAVRVILQRIDVGGPVELARGVLLFNQAASTEHTHHAGLLARLEDDSTTQLRLELAAPLAILAVGLVLLPLARRRIIKPLDDFGAQLERLADGQFTPTPLDGVEPFLLPLHQQFNTVATRLQELEEAHRARTATLESEVRSVTRTLLEQHRTLARAERLAATGELAASVAHELRNPLAGIQMTLSNLRSELADPEQIARVERTGDEVARLTRLLNQLLDSARHTPETSRPLRLAYLVDELLALTRCQVAPEVRLVNRVDPTLTVRLPHDRVRQALLNLLLNAAAALGPAGGTIQVESAVDGDRLRLGVVDDGPGFPPALLHGGVRPFFSTRERGTGLGLAMVQRLARDLGGELQLANVEPHGARATLLLPLDADA